MKAFEKAVKQVGKKYPEAMAALAKVVAEGLMQEKKIEDMLMKKSQVATITVEGVGPNGKIYKVEFEITIPKNTQIVAASWDQKKIKSASPKRR